MLNVQENINLKNYATMALPAVARYFVSVTTQEQLQEVIEFAEDKELPIVILGEGSNSLFVNDVNAVVIKIDIKGIDIVEQDESTVLLSAAAGENWDGLVQYALSQNFYGIENLSWIPGAVGAAPVQNIGAYGVELSDCLEWVDVWHIQEQKRQRLSKQECQLSYRESIFKQALKDKVIILNVGLRLSKHPNFKLGYAALESALPTSKENITGMQVRETVIAVRDSKLPNPQQLPNAGSFFKNPIITKQQYAELKAQHENLPSYPVDDVHVKVPAAWLIDQAGWKGKQQGNVAVHDKQALVLVNHNNAQGNELVALAKAIQEDIKNKYSISLEIEPRVIRK